MDLTNEFRKVEQEFDDYMTQHWKKFEWYANKLQEIASQSDICPVCGGTGYSRDGNPCMYCDKMWEKGEYEF